MREVRRVDKREDELPLARFLDDVRTIRLVASPISVSETWDDNDLGSNASSLTMKSLKRLRRVLLVGPIHRVNVAEEGSACLESDLVTTWVETMSSETCALAKSSEHQCGSSAAASWEVDKLEMLGKETRSADEFGPRWNVEEWSNESQC